MAANQGSFRPELKCVSWNYCGLLNVCAFNFFKGPERDSSHDEGSEGNSPPDEAPRPEGNSSQDEDYASKPLHPQGELMGDQGENVRLLCCSMVLHADFGGDAAMVSFSLAEPRLYLRYRRLWLLSAPRC